jgi:hypothetical protein
MPKQALTWVNLRVRSQFPESGSWLFDRLEAGWQQGQPSADGTGRGNCDLMALPCALRVIISGLAIMVHRLPTQGSVATY